MRHVVLIKAAERTRLPSAETLRAAGFRVSSAVKPGAGTKEPEDDGEGTAAGRERAGPVADRDGPG